MSSLDDGLFGNLMGLSDIFFVDGREGDDGRRRRVFSEGTGLEEYICRAVGATLWLHSVEVIVMGRRWKLGAFNTQAKFTAGRPNASLGPAAKTRIPVGSAFHMTEKMQPQYHCRIYR